jgi:hypothetical protein
MTTYKPSDKGRAKPPREPKVLRWRSTDSRRVGANLPTELYVAFKAFVARTGGTGEQTIVEAIERLLGRSTDS